MHSISWFEAVRASISSCIPCFSSSDETNSNSNSSYPPSHLRALLATPNDDDETLSLHSDIGRRHRTSRRTKPKRGITFFGYSLFGKRHPPIHLPDDEDNDGEEDFLRPHRHSQTSSSSSYTFDSDAAPLDSAAITAFTAQDAAAAAARALLEQQNAERLAKEERRRRRRERRLARSMALGGEGDFEGFQGSSVGGGGSMPHRDTPMQLSPHDNNEEEEEVDLDGIIYSRSSNSQNGGSGRSNSDSRTSSSVPKSKRSAGHSSSSKTRSSASVVSPTSPTFGFKPVRKVDPAFEGVDFDAPRIYHDDDAVVMI